MSMNARPWPWELEARMDALLYAPSAHDREREGIELGRCILLLQEDLTPENYEQLIRVSKIDPLVAAYYRYLYILSIGQRVRANSQTQQ